VAVCPEVQKFSIFSNSSTSSPPLSYRLFASFKFKRLSNANACVLHISSSHVFVCLEAIVSRQVVRSA
jgi:hypothetical protein